MIGYIYSLKEKNDIFYIGCTINPEQRLKEHNIRFKYAEYYDGICRLKNNFNGVSMEIIEDVDFLEYNELFALENYWIHQFIAWGFELINISYAGVKKYKKEKKIEWISSELSDIMKDHIKHLEYTKQLFNDYFKLNIPND